MGVWWGEVGIFGEWGGGWGEWWGVRREGWLGGKTGHLGAGGQVGGLAGWWVGERVVECGVGW